MNKVAYLGSELKEEILSLTITEDDVKIVANDVKLILDSAFEYYQKYNNPEEFSKLMTHNYGTHANWLIKELSFKEIFEFENAISKNELYEVFDMKVGKSKSTFETTVKKLVDGGILNRISTGKKVKGEDNVFLYLNKEVLSDDD